MKNNLNTICFRASAILLISLVMATSLAAQVKMWEEKINIPTHEIGIASPHPTFKREIDMLADDDQIYPYLYNSKITEEFGDKQYIGCFLENEYVKLLVTPELGGKLYGAKDKSNDYNFIYWQPTVKPALISLTGPWTSGGIEWCFPSGHRQTTFQQIGHRLIENSDSSKTIWVGETEWVHGLKWAVGVTLYPGKSVIEAKMRMMNPTRMKQSQYMWAIAATHADSSYQMIYPTEFMTGHNKFDYTPWPMNDGVDISWWKNIPNANSYFTHDLGSFFGGYNHSTNAGTVFTGNKYTMIGKKFWTWGSSPFGRMWDWILSDGGGPYAEPQAGAFSDNQPDFHWMNPSEVKTFSLFFYPVKEIGAYKEANKDGALNLEFYQNSVSLGVYSTSELQHAKIILSCNAKIVYEKEININPKHAFTNTLPIVKLEPSSYTLQLVDSTSAVILSYSPSPTLVYKTPSPAMAYEDPALFQNVDELWNIGDFLLKSRDKNKANDFFKAVLEKDIFHSRANVSLAQMNIDMGEYEVALKYLENASKRSWDDGELFYLKGVANQSLGNYELAYSAYYRSVHLQTHFAQGYEQIAKIDLLNHNTPLALEHITKALTQNGQSPQLHVLQSMAYRLSGQYNDALRSVNLALEFDPINISAIYEIKLSNIKIGDKGEHKELIENLLLDDIHNYIELANGYIETGQFLTAIEILEQAKLFKGNSLIYYYIGYCFDKLGNSKKAEEAFAFGYNANLEKVFPFRRIALDVFNNALKYNAKDDKAHYYLGLTYIGLNNGITGYEHFNSSINLNDKNAFAYRNMGFLKGGFNGVNSNLEESLKFYAQAFELRPEDDKILLELDKVKTSLNVPPNERLKFLKKNIDVVKKRDELLVAMLDLMVAFGEYKLPILYYEKHIFNNREGGYNIHNSYMNAYIGLANSAKSYEQAIDFYEKATLYPSNLKVKPRTPNLRGFLYYPMAILYGKNDQPEIEKELLKITALEHTELPTLANYYQALALLKVNPGDLNADFLLHELEKEAYGLIEGKSVNYQRKSVEFRKALGFYYLSVIQNNNKQNKEAAKSLEKAKKIHPFIERDAIIWAQIKFAGTNQ